jgi:putative amino-acid transport system permease protein
MGATQKEAAGSFLYFEAFLVVALLYWIIVEALSQVQKLLEIRLNRAFAR